MPGFVTETRLCLDAARERIVDCNSPEAVYQLAAAGVEISAETVARYGLTVPAGIEPRLAAELAQRPGARSLTVQLDIEADADILSELRRRRAGAGSGA
jgi:hypothetical protein